MATKEVIPLNYPWLTGCLLAAPERFVLILITVQLSCTCILPISFLNGCTLHIANVTESRFVKTWPQVVSQAGVPGKVAAKHLTKPYFS